MLLKTDLGEGRPKMQNVRRCLRAGGVISGEGGLQYLLRVGNQTPTRAAILVADKVI